MELARKYRCTIWGNLIPTGENNIQNIHSLDQYFIKSFFFFLPSSRSLASYSQSTEQLGLKTCSPNLTVQNMLPFLHGSHLLLSVLSSLLKNNFWNYYFAHFISSVFHSEQVIDFFFISKLLCTFKKIFLRQLSDSVLVGETHFGWGKLVFHPLNLGKHFKFVEFYSFIVPFQKWLNYLCQWSLLY